MVQYRGLRCLVAPALNFEANETPPEFPRYPSRQDISGPSGDYPGISRNVFSVREILPPTGETVSSCGIVLTMTADCITGF